MSYAALVRVGVTEVVLAINYKPEIMNDFLKKYSAELNISIVCSEEKEPLGTAGPLALAKHCLTNCDSFFVLNSDIICEYPLQEMIDFHRSHDGEGTILVTKVEEPNKYGVVLYDSSGCIEVFAEKPRHYVSNKINAGIYLFNSSVLSRIDLRPTSMEKEVFPVMASCRSIYAMPYEGFWMDIGHPGDYLAGLPGYLEHLASSTDHVLAAGEGIVGNVLVDPTARIGHGCVIGPDVTIGPRCVIEDGVRLKRTTLLNDVKICSHAWVDNSIIGWKSTVGRWARLNDTTVLGEDVHVGDEMYVTGGLILPHKTISQSIYEPRIVM